MEIGFFCGNRAPAEEMRMGGLVPAFVEVGANHLRQAVSVHADEPEGNHDTNPPGVKPFSLPTVILRES